MSCEVTRGAAELYSRATVNRVLQDAERRGAVELRRGKTAVLDLEVLRVRRQ